MAKKIYCLAEMATQFDLETDLRGGGEKVLNDFVTLLKQNNYDIYLYQFSYDQKVSKFRGHKIYGIGNIPKNAPATTGYAQGIDYFLEQAKDADGIYLLSANLSIYAAKIPTITVSHGVIFNHCEKNDYLNPINNLENFKKWMRNANHIISCDTDTLHLASVYCPQVLNKMTYIPNYVDLKKFPPREKKDNGIFRILFPRRLQKARGYHILMKSCDVLLDKYKNIEVIFCGKGNKPETDDLHKWMETKDDRVKHVIYEPDDMPHAYENISVGLVPSCYAEGLSLSLLELFSSKIIPITTWIGGLSDLAQNGVNSIVIPPNNVEALTNAIEYVMNNPEHVEEMRENGQRAIKHFGKDRWDKQIMEVVKKVYGEPND